MEYVSLVGAVSSVIAAIYAAMAYYRMKSDDSPTLHTRLLERLAEGEYLLVLEVHPGKRPVKYKRLSVRGGYIGPAENTYAGDFLTVTGNDKFRKSHKVNIFVPAAVARDIGPDLSFIVRMKNSAVVSLHARRVFSFRKLRTRIDNSMAVD